MTGKNHNQPENDYPFLPRRVRKVEDVLDKRQPDLVMVAEDIYKVHNLSALIRTCEALGVYKIHAVRPAGGKFEINNDITQGCHRWVQVELHDEIEPCVRELKARGLVLVVADPERGVAPWEIDFARPTAIVFGNELSGISEEAKLLGDEFVKLPMYGFTRSFNISVAAGMVLYEAMKQRLGAGMLEQRRLDGEEYEALKSLWLSRGKD